MEKAGFFLLCVLFTLTCLWAQAAAPKPEQTKNDATAVSVAVHVLAKKQFVGDLALQDFELIENGSPRPVQALYLIRKNKIERSEGTADLAFPVNRKFYVLFQLPEYHAKILPALEYLFKEELLPGDTLDIQTPIRNYKLTDEAFAKKPKNVLAKELNDIVKKDIVQGGMAYNSVMQELKRLARRIGGSTRTSLDDVSAEVDYGDSMGLESQLTQYRSSLQKMESLRALDENKMLDFARTIKSQEGRKHVFYVYQREFRPEINAASLNQIMRSNQDRSDIMANVQDLFQSYNRDLSLNPRRLREGFADSGATFNLLYINRQPERISGINMREQSEDIFKAFSGIAQATGGLVDTSANPDSAVKEALKATDAYYLLCFLPDPGPKTGAFRTLQVRVKNKDYTVVHQTGHLY